MAKQKSKPKATLPKATLPKPTHPAKPKMVTVPLNAGTSIFFQSLVHKGLAKFEYKPKMGDNVTASVGKSKDGSPNIIVHASFICWAPEDIGK